MVKTIKIIKNTRDYITKHKNIPASIKVDGNKYNYGKLNSIFLDYILDNKTEVSNKIIGNAPAPTGNIINTTIKKDKYKPMLETLQKFIKANNRNPNYYELGKTKISPLILVDVLSRIALFKYENKRLPNTVDIKSSIVKKVKASPIQSPDKVYNHFVKVFGVVKTIDEALNKIKGRGYGHYFNNYLTNIQVIDNLKASGKPKPNCVDVMQMLHHIGTALGYDVKIIHVKCNGSGEGHVFGKFRHKVHTGGKWITRDGACVVSPNGKPLTCVWCGDGRVQAVNPAWFVKDLNK